MAYCREVARPDDPTLKNIEFRDKWRGAKVRPLAIQRRGLKFCLYALQLRLHHL
jgi:hypothetical protein